LHSLQNQDMPYEKFLTKGAESLTDAELLAVLLRTGNPSGDHRTKGKCSALVLAEQLLSIPAGPKRGIAGLCSLSPAQLMQIKGIGEVKAVRICCINELARRIAMAEHTTQPVFTNPAMVAEYFRPYFAGEDSRIEKAILLMLDAKSRLIREKVISIGTVNTTLVSPREIFLQALRHQAVQIVLLHNHPSGDVKPSREDMEVTARLCEVGDMLELPCADHIIVGEKAYFSFREAGLI